MEKVGDVYRFDTSNITSCGFHTPREVNPCLGVRLKYVVPKVERELQKDCASVVPRGDMASLIICSCFFPRILFNYAFSVRFSTVLLGSVSYLSPSYF
ncbi:hypothetical protein R1flu_021912 [Riccia fluitans]|uniref:Uncharacterized protein n=1 Tax=Riccia fluitans TaxID=41844 RepID=A0ABD1ZTP2_9MARC